MSTMYLGTGSFNIIQMAMFNPHFKLPNKNIFAKDYQPYDKTVAKDFPLDI